MVPFSTSARRVVTIRPRRSDESPTCSGLAAGRLCACASATVRSHSSATQPTIVLFMARGLLCRSSVPLHELAQRRAQVGPRAAEVWMHGQRPAEALGPFLVLLE